ncbi:MAG TPA: O-antigen ligase family protein [Anaerolineae bacterium]
MLKSILADRLAPHQILTWAIIGLISAACVVLGYHPSILALAALLAIAVAAALIRRPILGPYLLVIGALFVPLDIPTGTEVPLNAAVLVVAAMLAFWLVGILLRAESGPAASIVNRPYALFLGAGLLSLVVGTAIWDPMVPRTRNFLIVQFAQWAIFALSGAAMWRLGRLARGSGSLRALTYSFLGAAGVLAILFVIPGSERYLPVTFAIQRAPFWALLTGLALGQLLFNRSLSGAWRAFLVASLVAVILYAFFDRRERLSNMVGVVAVAGVLLLLRWPHLSRPALVLLVGLAFVFHTQLYDFAGGSAKWDESGGSRLVLIGRVIEVSLRNPITGLGPAAYRSYARLKPLAYQNALWLDPLVNSHNNYVDLFSQLGVLGLVLFIWFAVSMIRLALRLRRRYRHGFEGGYVNGMLACWCGALVIMLLADWILPFVYNIGFPGFQASILIWLFLGGLVALESPAANGPGSSQAVS